MSIWADFKDGKYSEVKWGQSNCDQAAIVLIFTEGHSSQLI